MNKVRAIGIYYGQIFAVCVICSLSAYQVIHTYGWELFAIMFWFKVATTLLAMYLNNVYRSKEVYFYYNLGIKREILWGSVLLTDSFIFMVFLFLFFQPK